MASRFFIFSNPEIPFAKGQPAVFSFYSQCWHLQMDTKAPFMSFNSRGLKENKAKFLEYQFMLGWHERESETLVFQKAYGRKVWLQEIYGICQESSKYEDIFESDRK